MTHISCSGIWPVAPTPCHPGVRHGPAGLCVDCDDPDEMARAEAFATALAETALRLGGTVSGEHGVGLGKQKFMAREYADALAYMRAVKMRAVKAGFDPNNILNPGKLLPAGH